MGKIAIYVAYFAMAGAAMSVMLLPLFLAAAGH
jgi:hypothetical protein